MCVRVVNVNQFSILSLPIASPPTYLIHLVVVSSEFLDAYDADVRDQTVHARTHMQNTHTHQ